MTVWSHLPTILRRRHVLRSAGLLALCVAFITTLFLGVPARAAQNVTQTINFQGRLLNSSGGLIPDGHYNIQYKIYQDISLAWTETYINNNSTAGVEVKNGYFSVNLGSLTPFGTSIDWSQDNLWLSINVAGSATACTTFGSSPCIADGEMTPMTRITAVPFAVYAHNADALDGLQASSFVQLAQGVQTDASSNTSSIFINKTASGNLLQLQNTAVDVFTVDNGGNIMMGSNSNHSISIAGSSGSDPGRSLTVIAGAGGSSGASGGDLVLQGGAASGLSENGGSVVINAGAKTGSGINGSISIGTADTSSIIIGNATTNSPVSIRGITNISAPIESTSAFNVTTSLGWRILTVDTENVRVGIGHLGPSGTPTLAGAGLEIQGALRLSGGTDNGNADSFHTPVGSWVGTKINIPLYDPGEYGQILALGLPSTAHASSRVLSLFDARTSAHQPTIGVFSPDESNLIGFSWDGSNSVGAVKNTGNSIALQGNGLNLLTATNNGGVANVGIGNNASSGYALDVTGDINTSTQYRINGVSTLTNSSLSFSGSGTSTISAANGESLDISSDADLSITVNGTTKAVFAAWQDRLILGNGMESESPQNFTIQGTDSTDSDANGASLTVQGGSGTVPGAGGGDLILDGGVGLAESGGKVTIGAVNASEITIGNASSNISTSLFGNIMIKPATGNDSASFFQLQSANGTAMMVADSLNQTISFGNIASGDKTVISTATGQLRFYGLARNTKKIVLNAEYTGSVLDAGSGANNTGVMTSSVDQANHMNYYKWTTTQGTNQNYDVVVQIPLPTDFDGWAGANPLAISAYTSNTTNGTITLEARDTTGAVQCNFVSVTPGSTNTWASNDSACSLSVGTYTAGDDMTVRIRMQSPNGGDVRIGKITLSYLSKF